MAKSPNFENLLLDPKDTDLRERTFLGGFRFRARSNLFKIIGFASLFILCVIFFRMDQHINATWKDRKAAREFSVLIYDIQSSLARAETIEKTYFLSQDREYIDAFSEELSRVDSALDKFYSFPQAGSVRENIATLRDGIDQYNRQFTSFVGVNATRRDVSQIGMYFQLEDIRLSLSEQFGEAGLPGKLEKLLHLQNESLRAEPKQMLIKIDESYRTVLNSLMASDITKAKKQEFKNLIQMHQSLLTEFVNERIATTTARNQLSEILAYVASNSSALRRFTKTLDATTARELDRAYNLTRYSIVGATVLILLWFMFAGIVLFRSVLKPIQALAFVVGRLARGERGIKIPARGNKDASGQIARGLEKWIEDLADKDMVSNELQRVREKLELSVDGAEYSAGAATNPANAALQSEYRRVEWLHGSDKMPTPDILDGIKSEINAEQEPSVAFEHNNSGGGPIRYVSQQLTQFSEYVTAAAHDVERTEALIRSLGEANTHIEILGKLLITVQDKVAFLISELPSQEPQFYGTRNSILEDGVNTGDISHSNFQESLDSSNLNVIRVSTVQAERALLTIKNVMRSVNTIAQEIAKTASDQALEATNKLLSQSQHLQQMLDDIMTKINTDHTRNLLSEQSAKMDNVS